MKQLWLFFSRVCAAPVVNIVTTAQQADCCLQAICGYYVSIKGNLQGDTHTNSVFELHERS